LLGIVFAQSNDKTVGYQEQGIMTGRILLVEADAALATVLTEVLRHSGYEVVYVKTLIHGGGGIEWINPVNAVILDIDTPSAEKELAWLDGLPPRDKSLPIVLLGLQPPQDLRHRLRGHLGRRQTYALTLIQKPFRHEALLTAVRDAYESSLPRWANGT
jgi:DNA-binding NtrC family response regulator